jgi:predicted anti-sigma-YlaC factor YlaD
MSECAKIKRLLSRYLDAQASSLESTLIKQHLEKCSFCKQELIGLAQIKEGLISKARKTLPPDYLVCRLREKISRQEYAPGGLSLLAGMGNLSRRLIPLPVTAVFLSLVLLVVSFQPQSGSYSLEERLLDGKATTLGTVVGLILGEES